MIEDVVDLIYFVQNWGVTAEFLYIYGQLESIELERKQWVREPSLTDNDDEQLRETCCH